MKLAHACIAVPVAVIGRLALAASRVARLLKVL
jgi:hypothetical protein